MFYDKQRLHIRLEAMDTFQSPRQTPRILQQYHVYLLHGLSHAKYVAGCP